MLHTADMDPNLLGAVDDSIDPNIFNFIDVANSAVSPNLEDGVGFTWADDLISSAELDPSNSDSPTVSQGGMQHVVAATRQQMLAGGVVQHHMGGVQVMMGVQQQQQQGMVAVSSAGGVNAQQLMQNQTIIQGSMSSPYIIKASPAMPAATPSSIQASQSTNTMINASTHQYLPSSVTLVSRANTPSQSPSPHLSRSLTPSQTSSSMSRPPSQPQHMAASGASSQNINLLQLNQQQISQQVPLQNFVTNQTPQQGNLLQGHTVLASHGSNIVHTQNALIQNPNVVNVNVAHVLPNQLNLQGTLIQTPQGKFLIQSPAGGQQLQGQLNLGALSNLGQVQVAGGLHQTVMAQPTGSVALGNSPHQQPNFSLVNLGGPQGQQILIQRSPATHGVQAAQGGQVGQTNLILRTVAPNQQILQQQRIHATASSGQSVNMASAQVTQQLVTQTGASQNLQLQQLIGGGGQQLRLVQPTGTPQSQGQATLGGNVLLQSVVGGNQQVRLVGQQQHHQAQVSMAANKTGTVTLNLAGQNLNLQQLQQLGGLGGMQGIQLSTQQHPQFVIQQQPQIQVAGSNASVMTASIQQNSMQTVGQQQNSLQTVTQQVVNTGSGVNIGSKTVIGKSIANSANMFSDNILSQALTASGIEPEDVMDLFNGSEVSQDSMTMGQPEQQPTPPPPPKKKKKKKDLEPVQPVVLSSTKDLKSGLSTASPTAVTTTISQASVALPGQASHAVGLGGMHLTISGQNIITSVTTASIQPTIGMPAVAMPGSYTGTVVSAGMQVQNTPVRGKYAPPNVSVKPTMPNLQLSLAEKQQLKNIQNELQRLQLKATLSEADRALAQNLEMQRKKLLAQAQNQVLMAMNQQKQQVTVTSNMVGQPLVAQPQVLSQQQQQQSPSQLKLEVKPMNSASANNVLQIQAKPSNLPAKLKLVSPKLEPGMSCAQSDSTDLKPVLGMPVGQVTVANTQASLQTGTGNVVMAMSSPQGVGQVAGKSMILPGQQNVVRLQFAQKTQSVAMTPSTPQQVIIPSPQKVTVVSNGSGATMVTGSSAVQHVPVTNLAPSQARPVQIKIANQILMLQLTPAQQEKLELHLSRMTLDQQNVFFRTQQHVLAKLQLRTDPNMVNQQQNQSLQVAGGSQTGASVGGSTAAVMAPTVVAAVSAGGDAPSQKSAVLGTAPITVTTVTQPQQLPVTVQQALESTSIKTETCSSVSVHSPIIKRVHVPEIPKASMIHQQLSKDQANAVAPDTRNAFKDYREACRRLLRYHTFQSHGPSQDTFDEADHDFDSMSEDLVEQKDAMFTKYRYLLYEESMRGYPTAEMVFILRMMNQDMHNTLREDKMIAEKDPDSFIPMPAEYLEKKIPPDEDSDEEKQFYDDDDEEEDDEYEEGVEAVSDKEENGDEKDIRSAENKENEESEEGEFKDRERLGDDGENNETSLYDSLVSPSSAKIDDGGESRNDDIEDREAGESVSGSINDQSESANTSYENASFDNSFQTSTPAKGHRNVSKSDSLASSSPSPVVLTPSPEKPPSRSIFRLVIRNDGKGFTSRLASERRKSMSKAKHKKSRHHSGGDNSDDDSQQRTSGDEESEGSENDSAEIEYIDVDKYSRNVSVTLERLSDSMSQVYGVSAKSPSASAACVNTKSPSASSTSSSRKKRKAERDDESVRHKKDRHSDNRGEKEKSSAGRDLEKQRTKDSEKQRTKDSEKQRTKDLERQRASHSESPCGSSPGSTCDLKEGQSSSKTKHSESKKHSSGSSYKDSESTKHSSSSSHHDGVVKKHSSSSSNKGSSSKKHKDGSSRSGGNTPTPQGSSSSSSVSRNGLDEDSLGEDKDFSSAETRQDDNVEIDTSCAEKGKDRVNPLIHAAAGTVYSTSGSMHKGVKTETEMQFAVDSIMDLHDEQFHRQQDRGSHSDDLNEIVPESPKHSDQSANPPAFAEHIPPNLMQTDKMFNISSSDNEMETLYEPQMQNAIDSILNGSGGSNGNGETADKANHLSELSPGQKDDEDCDNVSGEESAAEHTGGDEGEGDSALITTDSQEMIVDDDLDAAVQSILM